MLNKARDIDISLGITLEELSSKARESEFLNAIEILYIAIDNPQDEAILFAVVGFS